MTECGSRFRVPLLRAMRPNLLTHSGMGSAPRTDGPTRPDDRELRAHIFDHPLILREQDVSSFLKSLVVDLNRLTLPTWMPHEEVISQLDEDTKDFLRKLELPCVHGRPSVLLHNLGNFVEEPELQRRVKHVFRPDTPKNAIFINTSGSGKTRLLFEGLCQHWGFYFASRRDSSFLGSIDLQNAIESTIPHDTKFHAILPSSTSPEYHTLLESNNRLAGRAFKRVFLARVLIFHLFVEAVKSSDNGFTKDHLIDYRRKWLLLQIQPRSFHEIDPFDDLTRKLSEYSDANLDELTKAVLRHVRNTLKSCVTSTSSSGCIPLYSIIDEAQFAATQHPKAFHSDDAESRSILRPLFRSFYTLTLGHDVFIILAGTGLSQSDVDDTMASAVMKPSAYRRCYNTGAFEGWEGRNGMSGWVGQFVPDWIFYKRNGEKLKERMDYWLNGRYRFVAGFVTELLVRGYQQPALLLDEYISQAIGCEINRGAEKQAKLDDIELELRDTFNFKKLDKDKFAKFRDILPHYVMRSLFHGPLGDDDQLWVEHGLGRLKKERGAVRVVFDEPLAVAAANRWFNAESNRSYAYFAHRIGLNDHKGSSNGMENFLVCCLDLIFGAEEQRELRNIFNFHGTVPSWAKKPAKLVSVHASSTASPPAARREPNIYYVHQTGSIGSSATLGMYAETPEQTLEWLDHRFRTPFCFPCRSMGPDVIFVLELYNGKLLWVALQTKYSENYGFLDNTTMKDAVRSVTPKKFFRLKNGKPFSHRRRKHLVSQTRKLLKTLPDGCDDEAGPSSLLRVIASFPARVDVNEKNWKRNDDKHPIATLNMELVKEVTMDLSPLNILERREQVWKDRYSQKKRRGSDAVWCGKISEKRRRLVKREEDSDASECSSRRSVDSQKRERDADDAESGREKRRKTLDVQGIKQKLGAAKDSKHRHIKSLVSVSLNRIL